MTAREGEVKLKADGDEATGATPNMFWHRRQACGCVRTRNRAGYERIFARYVSSAPEPPGKPPIAAQPEANRPEPAGQERGRAVPMTAGTAASPAAPGGNLQLNAGPEASPLADNKQTGKAGTVPAVPEGKRTASH